MFQPEFEIAIEYLELIRGDQKIQVFAQIPLLFNFLCEILAQHILNEVIQMECGTKTYQIIDYHLFFFRIQTLKADPLYNFKSSFLNSSSLLLVLYVLFSGLISISYLPFSSLWTSFTFCSCKSWFEEEALSFPPNLFIFFFLSFF